jgi:ADP-ribose pyrophosphatase YjhB (NUDIX family)
MERGEYAKMRQLNELRQYAGKSVYHGYPVFHERLFAQIAELPQDEEGRLDFPVGAWHIRGHVNQVHNPRAHDMPTAEDELRFREMNLRTDTLGRPLHPWLKEMIEDTALGVVTGKGAFWNWGPNRTADPLLVHDEHILLIRRGDTGAWAFPGGFVDEGEHAAKTARRELWEETGVEIPDTILPQYVYDGPVTDLRTTANAWPHTTAVMFKLDPNTQRPIPIFSDEVEGGEWVPLDRAIGGDRLRGGHKVILELALGQTYPEY